MNFFGMVLVAAAVAAPQVVFADPITGEWTTQDNSIASINDCDDRFCIVLKTGDWPGKEIGRLKAAGNGRYVGSVTDPRDESTYSGRATLKGDTLKLSGCALKLFCQTEIWSRR